MPEARVPEAEDTGTRPAPHLVPLADGWTLWRTVCLRGTGFPIHLLESLAADDAAASIDGFLDREAAWDEARDRAIKQCRDATKAVGKEVRKPYRRAIRHMTKGRVPEPIPDAPETAPLFEAMALAAVKAARGDPQALDAAMAGLETRFQRVTTKDPMRYGGEAVLRGFRKPGFRRRPGQNHPPRRQGGYGDAGDRHRDVAHAPANLVDRRPRQPVRERTSHRRARTRILAPAGARTLRGRLKPRS